MIWRNPQHELAHDLLIIWSLYTEFCCDGFCHWICCYHQMPLRTSANLFREISKQDWNGAWGGGGNWKLCQIEAHSSHQASWNDLQVPRTTFLQNFHVLQLSTLHKCAQKLHSYQSNTHTTLLIETPSWDAPNSWIIPGLPSVEVSHLPWAPWPCRHLWDKGPHLQGRRNHPVGGQELYESFQAHMLQSWGLPNWGLTRQEWWSREGDQEVMDIPVQRQVTKRSELKQKSKPWKLKSGWLINYLQSQLSWRCWENLKSLEHLQHLPFMDVQMGSFQSLN